MGSKRFDATSTSGHDAGKLNAAPYGMGMLLAAGYLGDATMFYCPSAAGMRGDTAHNEALSNAGNFGAASQGDWRSAGGTDANSLLFGYWRRSAPSTLDHVIYSSYNYRGIPFGLQGPWHRSWERVRDDRLAIVGTHRPIYAQIGNSLFQTSRQLNGRAIASDTFNKGWFYDGLNRKVVGANAQISMMNIGDTRQIAGFGIQAHRDAYNVLYGDGRATMYGDPQERIVWHTEGLFDNPKNDNIYSNHLSFNYSYLDFAPTGTRTRGFTSFNNGPWGVWHGFDLAADIDVGARTEW